jgi:8-oxo-dGTP diphosphatase
MMIAPRRRCQPGPGSQVVEQPVMAAPKYCYEYPRPAVTVDAVVLGYRRGAVSVLLIERRSPPFAGRLALPGGFLEIDEPAAQAARRELAEETGIATAQPLRPVGFYDQPGRDPRGRTISLAFLTTVRPPVPEPVGSDDAAASDWHALPALDLASLAFDHAQIVSDAIRIIRGLPADDPLPLTLLPGSFGRDDLKAVCAGLGLAPREASLRRRALERAGLIRPSPSGPHPYRIDAGRLKRLVAKVP